MSFILVSRQGQHLPCVVFLLYLLYPCFQTRPTPTLCCIFALLVVSLFPDKTDTYSFLIPVMKALLDKASNLLNLDLLLPDLPPTNHSPAFFDDFKTYCLSEQWTEFIENYVSKVLLILLYM